MTQNQINHYNSLMKQDAEHKEKVIEILETDFGWRNIEQRDELVIEMMQDTIEATKKAFSLTDVVKPLKDKYEIVFEDWLKDHKFNQDNKGFYKEDIRYKVNEITWMYIQDVYNL